MSQTPACPDVPDDVWKLAVSATNHLSKSGLLSRHVIENAMARAILADRASRALPSTALAARPEEGMARAMHEAYERLAPTFGYETRPDTRSFDPDSANGRLMIAVCREVFIAPSTPPTAGDGHD